jgi:recombinational DNA repair ATPase RecF
MKIISLFAENILNLKAVTIIPKSDIIEIKGRNGAGKSSLLKTIAMGFKGKKEFDDTPIRKGTKKGKLEIKLDGDKLANIPPFTITETITEKTTNLMIKPESVLSNETPRSFLDKLIGKISFDLMACINKEGKEQRSVLLDMLGIDVDALNIKEKEIFNERTSVGRELKTQQAKLDAARKLYIYQETRIEEIKISELSEQLTNAINFNNRIEIRKGVNEKIKLEAIEIRDKYIPASQLKISEWEESIRLEKNILLNFEKSLSKLRLQYKEEREMIDSIQPIDIDTINSQISDIETTNIQIRNNNNYLLEQKEYDNIKKEYDKLDIQIETIRAERISLLQSANMPVPGLSFDEDGLLYNGIPLKQCSTGESIMVWLPIAMKLNPTLRVLLIKDASLLDSKNMQIIRDILKKEKASGNEYQIFMEKMIEEPDGFGIFIEEGEVIFEDNNPVIKTMDGNKSEYLKGTGIKQPRGVITMGIDKNNLPDEDF